MPAITIVVRWITVEKTILSIPAVNNVKCIGTFDLAILESYRYFFGKALSFIYDFLGSGICCFVIAPWAVKFRTKALGA